MFTIHTIKVNGLSHGCVTDSSPTISFSLMSDVPGDGLEEATISVGDWQLITKDQVNNRFTGPLLPHTEYKVLIEAKSVSGAYASSETSFQTGKLDKPWVGKWISDLSYAFPDKASPIPMVFKKEVALQKPIKNAFVCATALGVYELEINGDKVGCDYFSPGFTSYYHQIQYQVYDVTAVLKEQNVVVAHVAGGWAVGSFNYIRSSKIRADRQAFLMELHVIYHDDTQEIFGTDSSWEVSTNGPYQMAEWYDGETFDANVSLSTMNWKKAGITKPRRRPELNVQYGSPVRKMGEMRPVKVVKSPSGELIYDFGQNFAGVISANIIGKKDDKIVFRHAEILHEGELFIKSLRTAKATATYICVEGKQHYSPKLTYMGFRYVGVSGIEESDLELSAIVLHSDFDEIGEFECSNPLINQLNRNIVWGGKSNFVDIPTDCPQRDERQGWTGDFAVFAQTAVYNFDLSRFIDKWLKDMRSEQGFGGGIPMVVPRNGDKWPVMATSAWGDSCILVPWAEYLARGNLDMLRAQYPTMLKFLKAAKRWASFLSLSPNARHIWKYPFHFGDWCAPGEDIKQWMKKSKWVATAYYANSCGIVSEVASLLGHEKEASQFLRLRDKITKAYLEVFTDGLGNLHNEFQTAYVLPLHFKMFSGDVEHRMAQNLADLVKKAGNQLTTGFTGTPYLLFALSDHGYPSLAYDVLLQENCPSWLYEVIAGGTTIWERWDSLRPDGTINTDDLNGKNDKEASSGGMVSFNHYANGAVGDWLYKRILGIEPTEGGYKSFVIKPVLGGNLTYAKGGTRTPYGDIKVDWQVKSHEFSIKVKVPCSTYCTLILPDGSKHMLKSGDYHFAHSL